MADADVDGHHINTLLLTLLFRFMKPLIEHGYVYMAQPPLYRIRWNKPAEHEFVYSDAERDLLMRDGQEQGKKLPKENPVQRYKGLGEMNAEELWDTTMNPEQRLMLQVTLDNAAQADEIFSILIGEDVEQRRSFIQRNAKTCVSLTSTSWLSGGVSAVSRTHFHLDIRRRRPERAIVTETQSNLGGGDGPGPGGRIQPIELAHVDAARLHRLRDGGHRRPRAARRTRWPEAGAPPRALRDVRRRLPPRPRLLEALARRR